MIDTAWAEAIVASEAPSQRELLHVIWHSHDRELVEQAVNHPAARDRTIQWSAIGPRLRVHASVVAGCRNPERLGAWSSSPDAEIRTLVALNPATPGLVVGRLLEDRDEGVRANAACP